MTYEIEDLVLEISDPHNALPLGTGRNLSRSVASVEVLQLIGGFADANWVLKHAPSLAPYREDDGEFWGAYGARIGDQLNEVVTKLRNFKDTRQAVITLWNPVKESVPGKRDYPCTIAIGFTIRSDRLNMRVTMRSNDAWLGLPYDMFQFAQLQLTIAQLLDVPTGTYTHTAWSMHLYARDLERSYDVTDRSVSDEVQPVGLASRHYSIDYTRRLAHDIAYGHANEDLLNDSERWFYNALHG